MKRPTVFFLGFLFIGPFVSGAGDAYKEDLKRLQGKWKVVEQFVGGTKRVAEGTWTINGNELSYGPDSEVKAIFTLDPTKNPKTFDFDHVSKDPKKVAKGFKGIYEIDGNALKICGAVQGEERPKAFESKEGSFHILSVLQRVKSDK